MQSGKRGWLERAAGIPRSVEMRERKVWRLLKLRMRLGSEKWAWGIFCTPFPFLKKLGAAEGMVSQGVAGDRKFHTGGEPTGGRSCSVGGKLAVNICNLWV
ncbi:hypothetical protein U1Q18_000864 [Sarracenia purpurea var. burkii]